MYLGAGVEPGADEVCNLGNHQLRDDERARMGLHELRAGGMVTVTDVN